MFDSFYKVGLNNIFINNFRSNNFEFIQGENYNIFLNDELRKVRVKINLQRENE